MLNSGITALTGYVIICLLFIFGALCGYASILYVKFVKKIPKSNIVDDFKAVFHISGSKVSQLINPDDLENSTRFGMVKLKTKSPPK